MHSVSINEDMNTITIVQFNSGSITPEVDVYTFSIIFHQNMLT